MALEQFARGNDLGLRDIVDLLVQVKAHAYSVEAATPHHAYEWSVWEDVTLPAGKVLIPGVIAPTTAVVEHPETVAERLMTFARAVRRESVIVERSMTTWWTEFRLY